MSYMLPVPGMHLHPADAVSLRVIFEGARQLGAFDGVTERSVARRLTWPEKLWALSVHWGIQQEPWPFDDLKVAPDSLDIPLIYARVSIELEKLEASQKQAQGPPSATPSSRTDLHNTRYHDQVVADADARIEPSKGVKEKVYRALNQNQSANLTEPQLSPASMDQILKKS